MIETRFDRIRRFIGEPGLRRLAEARVGVIGLGAVGGYAMEALARSGVGHLRLVDFDAIRVTNVNRQLLALESTLGQFKTDVAEQRVHDINPGCKVEKWRVFVDSANAVNILAGLDLAIDAIDSCGPKIELLYRAATEEIPVISCMGAALRTDPNCVRVGPLREVRNCPLARRVRKELRRRGVPLDLCCVYSTEPVGALKALAIGFDRPAEDETLKRGRTRSVLGSLPTLTGIFGLVAANTALKWLLGELPGGGFPASTGEDLL